MLVGFSQLRISRHRFRLPSYMSPLSYLYRSRGISRFAEFLLPMSAHSARDSYFPWCGGASPRCAECISAFLRNGNYKSYPHRSDHLVRTIVFRTISDARYGIGTTFIIDLWFTGVVLLGLLASLSVDGDNRRGRGRGTGRARSLHGFPMGAPQADGSISDRHMPGSNGISPVAVMRSTPPVLARSTGQWSLGTMSVTVTLT